MQDFLDESGPLFLGTRLRRLSEYFIRDAGNVCSPGHVSITPGAIVLLRLLQTYPNISLLEASKRLYMSQPLVSQHVRTLVKKGYIISETHPNDKRERILSLTKAGQEMLCTIRPAWQVVEEAAEKYLSVLESDVMKVVKEMESLMHHSEFGEYISQARQGLADELEIVEYTAADGPMFTALNKEWIARYFELEAGDLKMLEDLESSILAKGGLILLAKVRKLVIGTVALLPDGDTYELTKLAVSSAYQGQGIGRKLMDAALERAAKKVEYVYLLTNSSLGPANHIYRSMGFREYEPSPKDKALYQRCDIRYEYWFNEAIAQAV